MAEQHAASRRQVSGCGAAGERSRPCRHQQASATAAACAAALCVPKLVATQQHTCGIKKAPSSMRGTQEPPVACALPARVWRGRAPPDCGHEHGGQALQAVCHCDHPVACKEAARQADREQGGAGEARQEASFHTGWAGRSCRATGASSALPTLPRQHAAAHRGRCPTGSAPIMAREEAGVDSLLSLYSPCQLSSCTTSPLPYTQRSALPPVPVK